MIHGVNKAARADGHDTPKRGREEQDPQAPVKHGELTDILGNHFEKQRILHATMLEEQNTRSAKASNELLSDFTKATEARFKQHDNQIASINERVGGVQATQDQHGEKLTQLEQDQKQLRDALRLANEHSLTRDMVETDQFDRPPNIEIVRISAGRFVSKISVENAIRPWLGEAEIPEESWKLVGGTPNGRNFVLRFLQNPYTSAKLVNDCLGKLKDEEGNWRKFEADMVNGAKAKLHIGRDENPKTRCTRRLAKCFQEAILHFNPTLPEVHYRPKKYAVYSGKEGVCKLDLKSENISVGDFLWNYPVVDKPELNIDKDAIIQKSIELFNDEIQWG